MSKKQRLMVALERSGSTDDLNQNKDFLFHLQDALLLALAEQEKLTRQQYERCISELRRQQAADP